MTINEIRETINANIEQFHCTHECDNCMWAIFSPDGEAVDCMNDVPTSTFMGQKILLDDLKLSYSTALDMVVHNVIDKLVDDYVPF